MSNSFKIKGQIVDVVASRIFSGTVSVSDGKIVDIKEEDNDNQQVIMPGFIDSHVHIESSMVVPSEFARIAVTHGTVAAVCDPHEIANVLGIDGIKYMISNGKRVPFKFFFGAPSCVPATSFETSGAVIDSYDIERLMASNDIKFLGEMMNYPGVILNDKEIYKKLDAAKRQGKPIDGHAPGVVGNEFIKYHDAGISTDHECCSFDEACEKIKAGMIIQIREGSAAKNFDALIDLLNFSPQNILFCSDDKHIDDLIEGHINVVVKNAISLGYNILDVIKAASINSVKHYNLEVGLLQKNDPADFIVIDNFNNFKVIQTFIDGNLVAENGKSLIQRLKVEDINNFVAEPVTAQDFTIKNECDYIRIIEITDGQLITKETIDKPTIIDGNIVSDTERDILKIAVINRYEKKKPAVGFIKNFGLKKGAVASSIAHDSHNIVVVGCSDEEMAEAVNQLVITKGGIAAYSKDESMTLPMPIAGLMSDDDGYKVAVNYQKINKMVKHFGTRLYAPFMTLSFMSLLVIPELRLSDKGLFDCKNFCFTNLSF